MKIANRLIRIQSGIPLKMTNIHNVLNKVFWHDDLPYIKILSKKKILSNLNFTTINNDYLKNIKLNTYQYLVKKV